MSVTPIDIRFATADDAQLLAEIGARTFAETFGPDNTEEDMAAYLVSAFGVRIQAAEIADPESAFPIAQVDGAVAGYARLRFGESRPAVAGARPVEIARFYADSPWIGRGVGAALMTACLDLAADRTCDVAWLDVWERSPRAIAFYEKWGLAVVGSQKFRLGDDIQNDLLMARALG